MARCPRIRPLLLAGALITASFLGCSVKEDRDGCPCHIDLLFGGSSDCSKALYAVSGDYYASDTVPSGAGRYSLSVPRREVRIMLFSPSGCGGKTGLLISEGTDCPPIRMFSKSYDATCEYIRDSVRLSKNYCQLSVTFEPAEASVPCPFSVTVHGNICGYSCEGEPLPGPFRFDMKPGEGRRCSIRLPRQRDDSLLMDIISSEGTLRTFAIGSAMAEAGYDWDAVELEDCELVVDYSRTIMTLRTDCWSRTFSFQYFL